MYYIDAVAIPIIVLMGIASLWLILILAVIKAMGNSYFGNRSKSRKHELKLEHRYKMEESKQRQLYHKEMMELERELKESVNQVIPKLSDIPTDALIEEMFRRQGKK